MLISEALAQDITDSVKLRNNGLSILPQFAMINGIRFDYERRLGKGDLWLLVAPQLYIDSTPY